MTNEKGDPRKELGKGAGTFGKAKDAPDVASFTNLRPSNPLVQRLHSAINATISEERFGDLTVAQILGVLELVKYGIIESTPYE